VKIAEINKSKESPESKKRIISDITRNYEAKMQKEKNTSTKSATE